MTVQQLVLRVLRYSGVTSLAPSDNASSNVVRGLDSGMIDDVTAEVNAALQELAQNSPHLFKTNNGAMTLAPAGGLTLTATTGSKTISAFSGYTAAMRGCTIRITSDGFDNEIISATQLARPFLGTTGSGLSTTVYYDCIPLDPTIHSVIAPVDIAGVGRLALANSRDEFLGNFVQQSNPPQGFPYGGWTPALYNAFFSKQIGRPARWISEEGGYDGASDTTLLYLRLYPMPDVAYGILFQTIQKPPIYTAEDVNQDDDGSDPLTPVPFPWVESILLPIVKQRWTGHATFSRPEATPEIARQYKVALTNAEESKPTVGIRSIRYH